MRRKLSLLLCLVMLLFVVFLPSCKEEEKDREYDAEVVLREAALLVERSKLINFIFWGDGIPVREGEEAEKLGTYTEADGSFLEQHGIDSVDKLKKMTSEVYDKAFCNTIFQTKLAALQDSDGNRRADVVDSGDVPLDGGFAHAEALDRRGLARLRIEVDYCAFERRWARGYVEARGDSRGEFFRHGDEIAADGRNVGA